MAKNLASGRTIWRPQFHLPVRPWLRQ